MPKSQAQIANGRFFYSSMENFIRWARVFFRLRRFRVSAPFGDTGQKGSLFFSRFFHQESGAADGACLIHGFVPNGKSALRKPAAAVKYFASFGPFFNQPAAAIFFRAADAGIRPPVD